MSDQEHRPRTLSAIWWTAVAAETDTAAFLVPTAGGWDAVSWTQAGESVAELAAAFLALGIGRGETVVILSRTRLEWALCDWALISIGALPVPIQPTSSAHECAYIVENCGARVVVCEDATQLRKVASERDGREEPLQRIVLEGDPSGALGLEELRERGRQFIASDPGAVERARAEVGEDDPLTILYTSGTTGPPKGCVMTHRNYAAAVEKVRRIDGLLEPGDCALLHLPLAHSFARLVEFLGPAGPLTIALCPEPAQIPNALRRVRPTLLPSVPRFYERLASAIRSGFAERTGVGRRMIEWALAVGDHASVEREHGRRYPLRLAVEHALAERFVFARVRERFGGRLRFAISGGAPLAVETARFLDSLGVCPLEGYGLAECASIATVNRPGHYRLGTVGVPLDGVELRLAEDGEVLLRSETVFAGYYRDEEATRAALSEDGWLRTGDLGALDADGFLTITGRKKEIIVTTGGENISPQTIELALERSSAIIQAFVVGDRRPYLVALVAFDEEATGETSGTAQAHAMVQQAVTEVNRTLGRLAQIRRFAILPRPFSEEAGELTPTLKLRRHVCTEHVHELIDDLYVRRQRPPGTGDEL